MTRENRRANWAKLVQEQNGSGLNAAAWCRKKELNEKAFRRWKRNLKPAEISSADAPLPAGWCQIQSKQAAPKTVSLKLVVHDKIAIELQSGFDHQLLREVLAVLYP